MPKREMKSAEIKIHCTEAQKELIKSLVQKVGGRSISEYILTLAMNGNTDDYGFLRRKAEGALVNSATYQKLGELVEILQEKPSTDRELLDATIALIHEVRLEIATRRLANAVEKIKNEN